MTFAIAKKGARPSNPKIYVSEKAKTLTFSAGFFRTYDIQLNKANYVRLAFDIEAKEIALEFLETKKNDTEYLKLTRTQFSTSASCSINPILATFSIDIREVSGTYKGKALSGPVRINGFSDNGFILRIKNREV